MHEGYPGHHVGFWHLGKRRDFPCSELEQRAKDNAKNMFLLEGWALYAELLMIEHGYYTSPADLLAAQRGLLHRALRARVDVQLHTGKIDRTTAVDTYVRELLMTSEAAETEVRRHFSQPTIKATYFVGLIQILELRRRVHEHGGVEHPMPLAQFHDRLLRWSLPFPEVARSLFEVELDLSRVDQAEAVIPLAPRSLLFSTRSR